VGADLGWDSGADLTQVVETYICASVWPSQRLTLNEGGGDVHLDLPNAMALSDALEEWEDQANAHGSLALTYSFSRQLSAHTVTLAASGAFDVTLGYSPGATDLRRFLGFSTQSLSSASSYVSDETPIGFVAPTYIDGAGIDLEAREQLTDGELRVYRHGRPRAVLQHRGFTRRIRLRLPKTAYDAAAAGPLWNAAMRITYFDGRKIYLIPLEVTPTQSGMSGYWVDVDILGVDVGAEITGWTGLPYETDTTALLAQDTWTWGRIASALPFGGDMVYGVWIEGIGNLFVERDYGFTEEASSVAQYTEGLVIDDSARVGSLLSRDGEDAGIARGFDLTIGLEDNAAVRALFARPTNRCRLTADIDAGDGGVNVDDTTGFGSLDHAHIGTSRFDYSGTTGTTFTGVTWIGHGPERDYPIAENLVDVTDTPRIWRGRRVWLTAIPITPCGEPIFGSGTSPDRAVSPIIWRGYIAGEPVRSEAGLFQLQCRSIERRLTDEIIAPVTGKAVFDFSQDGLLVADWTQFFEISVTANGPGGTQSQHPDALQILPFAGTSIGDVVSASATRATISSQWAAKYAALGTAVPANFPILGELVWEPHVLPGSAPPRVAWYGKLEVTGDSDTSFVTVHCVQMHPLGSGPISSWYDPVFGTEKSVHDGDTVYIPILQMIHDVEQANILRVKLDDGDTTTVPSSGWVKLESDDGKVGWRKYSSTDTDDAEPNTIRIVLDGATGYGDLDMATDASGYLRELSVTFGWSDSGSVADVMRRLLMTSGRGDNDDWLSDSYDTGDRRAGYDISEVDADSFDEVFDGAFLSFAADIYLDEKASFTSLFSGLCALSQRALVARRNGPVTTGSGPDLPWTLTPALRLTAVHAGLVTTGRYEWTIDQHALAVPLRGGSPVRPVAARPVPNRVSCELHRIVDADSGKIVVSDVAGIQSRGPVPWEIELYGVGRGDVLASVQAWALGLFAGSATVQVVELDVHPWVEPQPGDAVYVDLPDEHRLWQWSAGQPGYQGPGRVIGEQTNLRTGVRTLTVLVDGATAIGAISPSAPLLDADDWASASTTWIEVAAGYYPIMAAFLRDDASFDLVAYLPSEDTSGSTRYTIDAVEIDAGSGNCRMTVDSVTGSFTASTSWFVTLPTVSVGTDAQDVYTHADQEGVWG